MSIASRGGLIFAASPGETLVAPVSACPTPSTTQPNRPISRPERAHTPLRRECFGLHFLIICALRCHLRIVCQSCLSADGSEATQIQGERMAQTFRGGHASPYHR